MRKALSSRLAKEERIVAELSHLGVTFLSRMTTIQVSRPRDGSLLLADLVRQPSSRVRTAVIALLLEHPELADEIPVAISRLRSKNRITLKLFYTAAVYLQRLYARELRELQGSNFHWLPDSYSAELGINENAEQEERILELGKLHQVLTGSLINWTGTYENVIHKLLRRRKLELQWNQ